MLALVKTPHTEIILNGTGASEIIDFLKTRFAVQIFSADEENDLVNINDTSWWKNNRHRVLAGARRKAELTQKQLADAVGIRQSVLSEYERGKRKITPAMAEKLAAALNTWPEKFLEDRV